jgi:hypothetical protein
MPAPSKRSSFVLAFLIALFFLFGPCAPGLETGRMDRDAEPNSTPDESTLEGIPEMDADVSAQGQKSGDQGENPAEVGGDR